MFGARLGASAFSRIHGHRLRQQCPQNRSLAAQPSKCLTGCNTAETVSSSSGCDRLLSLHSSRRDLEPSVRQELIGYVGFAASTSAAPPAAVGRLPTHTTGR
jgi:hypothetical protein